MENFNKWLMKGKGNWRFVAIAGSIALIAVVLVFGMVIKNRISAWAVTAQAQKVATYQPPKPEVTADIPAAQKPEPDPTVWKKAVDCDKLGCWDPDTDRRLFLGKPR